MKYLRMAEDDEDAEPLDDVPDWQLEDDNEIQEFLNHQDDFLELPTRDDIHEYDIMQDFCLSIADEQISSTLLQTIRGSGAFRRFKDLASGLGVIDQWYRFRDEAFKKIAVEWCEDNHIDYIDDIIISDDSQIRNEKKHKLFIELETSFKELLKNESDMIANAANMAALIYHNLPDVNWAGFYFLKGDELVLGPFQGQPACMRIPIGRGVCGTAAQQRKSILVADVHQFPGHIACDTVSNSEIVIPLIKDEKLLGVLDIDSPTIGRFDEEDQKGLERLVEVFVNASGHFRDK